MEQKRSRLVAPDATGLRARILSTGGLLVVAAMVLVLLAMLYPRQQLIERLRAEPRNDELSVSYLANLLSSEPDNDELRILLAERHFALGQTDRTEATLQPMLRKALASEDTRQRLYRLTYRLLEQRANAARPGSPEALALRTQLIEALQARLSMDWTTPQLLEFARKATALEQLGLAEVDVLALKQAGLVSEMAKVVKVIKSGSLTKAVKLNGVGATAGAKAAIEAAGGSVA